MLAYTVKILLIQYMTCGDVIVMTAITRALRKKYGDNCVIHFMTLRENMDLLYGNPDIDRVLSPLDEVELELYDIVLRPFKCLQEVAAWERNELHFVEMYAHIAGVDLSEVGYKPVVVPACIEHLKVRYDIPSDYIIVHTTTNDPAKHPTLERWKDIVDALKREFDLPLLQIGGASDQAPKGIDIDMRGKTSMREAAKFIQDCKCLVGVDSFSVHVASALNVPFVGLYGAKPVDMTGPNLGRLEEYQIALEPEKYCDKFTDYPCFLASCLYGDEVKCINNISSDAVVGAVKTVMGEKS